MNSEEGRFVVAVGAMIEHAGTGKILLMKRAGNAAYAPGIWEDMAGRVKQFEEPEDALRREVKEETGLEIEIVKPIAVFRLFRGEETADNEVVVITFWCRTSSDTPTLSEEHSDFRWVTPHEALELAEHPGVRKDIEAFIRESQYEQ